MQSYIHFSRLKKSSEKKMQEKGMSMRRTALIDLSQDLVNAV